MNRCTFSLRPLGLATALALACLSRPAEVAAQQESVRQFPAQALRGTLRVTVPPEVQLNGDPARLAPGARIRGPNNMLVMSASLVGQTYLINYVANAQGQLQDVWLLTPAEAAEKRAGLETITNFRFESQGDRPRADDGKTPYHLLPGYPR